jgi:serine/threonine protein kinase
MLSTGDAPPARFVKEKLLGVGFTGEVWSARDLCSNGTVIAVKTLSRELYDRHRLSFPPQEVAIAASLVHENVVRVLEVIEEPERIFLVQEHLSGGDLFSCMQESGLFSEFLARCLFGDILAGVAFLHERGVVHRDLKPENCALDAKGTVKIIDFGLATRFEKGQLLHEYCGSPEYAAPEVMKQVPHEGPPTDMWSIGVILYDMVMGRLPFDAEPSSFDLLDIDESLTPEFQQLLKQILVEDPQKRANAYEVAKCDWMHLAACVGDNSEMDLVSTSESSSSTLSATMSLSEDSPLRKRVSFEQGSFMGREMGFAEKVLFGDD